MPGGAEVIPGTIAEHEDEVGIAEVEVIGFDESEVGTAEVEVIVFDGVRPGLRRPR